MSANVSMLPLSNPKSEMKLFMTFRCWLDYWFIRFPAFFLSFLYTWSGYIAVYTAKEALPSIESSNKQNEEQVRQLYSAMTDASRLRSKTRIKKITQKHLGQTHLFYTDRSIRSLLPNRYKLIRPFVRFIFVSSLQLASFKTLWWKLVGFPYNAYE